MAKKPPASSGLPDDFIDKVITDVRFNRADKLIMIGIPSHDQKKKALPAGEQSLWANNAMKKFADLFRGATAMRTYKGIYKSDSGEYLWDDTIIVQAYALAGALEEETNIRAAVKLARDMKKALDQEAVFVVFDGVVRFI